MREIFYFFTFITVVFVNAQSLNIQSTEIQKDNKNLILFAEVNGGFGSNLNYFIFYYGANLNYQYKKALFTLRYTEFSKFNNEAIIIAPVIVLPYFFETSHNKEIAALTGPRWISDGFSASLSLGVSYNEYYNKYKFEENNTYHYIKEYKNFIGIPYEINFKFFKSKKKTFRFPYGTIPIGEPTSFGRSVGFKIIGNFSKESYFGIGLSWGFGMHKQY